MAFRVSSLPFPIKLFASLAAFVVVLAVLPQIAGWLGIAALVLWAVVVITLLHAAGLMPAFIMQTIVGQAARWIVGTTATQTPRVQAPLPIGATTSTQAAAPIGRADALKRGEAVLRKLRGTDPAVSEILNSILPRARQFEREKRPLLGAARGLVVIVSGPPGVGKSTVARALADIFYGTSVVTKPAVTEIEPPEGGRYGTHWKESLQEAADGIVMLDNAGWLAEADPLTGSVAGDSFLRLVFDTAERLQGRLTVILSITDGDLAKLEATTGGREVVRRLTIRRIAMAVQPPELLVELLRDGLAARHISIPDGLGAKVRRLIVELANNEGERFDHAEAMRRIAERLEEQVAPAGRREVTTADLEAVFET